MTNRRVWLIACLAVAGPAWGTFRAASAATSLGWADEFTSSRIICNFYESTDCAVFHMWDGDWASQSSYSNERWAYAGSQGASSGGRANAHEKVMSDMAEVSSSQGLYLTVKLERWSRTPPSEGTSCTAGIQFVVGSSSYTYTNSGAPAADHYHNHRLLPSMNFSLETASAGTTVGYHTRITGTNFGGSATYEDGCFKIYWF